MTQEQLKQLVARANACHRTTLQQESWIVEPEAIKMLALVELLNEKPEILSTLI